MDFIVETRETVVTIARAIGYAIIDAGDNGEYNLVRKLTGNNYPRFHIYMRQQGAKCNFSLHLDQKAPVYQGSHAHAGEYDSPVVMNEVDRIKSLLQ